MKTTNKLMGKLGLVVMAVAAMGGCSTMSANMGELAARDKNGSGEMLGFVSRPGGVVSAESVCNAFPGLNDVRCAHPELYDGLKVLTHQGYWAPKDFFPVLAPKTANVGSGDIVKFTVIGNRPAEFDLLAAKFRMIGYAKFGEDDCYVRNLPYTDVDVICPKYNWDSRKDINKSMK